MRIAIYGMGKIAETLYQRLKQTDAWEIVAFVDSHLSVGTHKVHGGGTIILSPAEAFSKENDLDAVFIAAGAQKSVLQMTQVCRSYGIDNIYLVDDVAGKTGKAIIGSDNAFIPGRVHHMWFSDEKPSLTYFEMPIVDSCNLNCKGCLFAYNQEETAGPIALVEIKSDLKQMADRFADVAWIRFLGGEPLLHPDLVEILSYARRLYPATILDVCTNGLLIPSLDEAVLEAIKDNHISLHISGYQPTYKLLDRIDKRLTTAGIDYYVLRRDEFYKFYTLEPDNDSVQSHTACPSCACWELYHGRIMKCSAVLAFEKMNRQFGTQYQVIKNEDWFDIYDENLKTSEIYEKCLRHSQMCRYCNLEKKETFPWTCGQKEKLSDYILE